MKYSNKQLKSNARASLLGHYGIIIGAFIFTELLVGVLNTPFNQILRQGLNYSAPLRVVLGTIGSLFVSLVSMLFSVGLIHIHLQIARGQQTRFSELFFVFKNRPDRYIGYSIVMLLLSVVCVLPGMMVFIFAAYSTVTMSSIVLYLVSSILLLIGCIVLMVLTLGLALTPYILLDNPSMHLKDTLKLSLQLMKGQKLRLFLLQLSFLGWLLFSVLTFGLGLLWISPYMSQTITWFYLGFITD